MDKIEGLHQLNKALKELPLRASKRALKSGIRAGGREIVKAARSELKKYNKTGNLSKSLTVKVLRPRAYHVTAIIGPRVGKQAKYDGHYAHILEYGAAPHEITPLTKKVLAIHGQIIGTKVKHPGIKAHPFMRPGFHKSKSYAMKAIQDKLWEAIKREAAKLK